MTNFQIRAFAINFLLGGALAISHLGPNLSGTLINPAGAGRNPVGPGFQAGVRLRPRTGPYTNKSVLRAEMLDRSLPGRNTHDTKGKLLAFPATWICIF